MRSRISARKLWAFAIAMAAHEAIRGDEDAAVWLASEGARLAETLELLNEGTVARWLREPRIHARTVPEVSELVGLSPQQVQREISDGHLTAAWCPFGHGRWLVTDDCIELWQHRRETRAYTSGGFYE
jgi:protein involved in temperature-dependent protein secretion